MENSEIIAARIAGLADAKLAYHSQTQTVLAWITRYRNAIEMPTCAEGEIERAVIERLYFKARLEEVNAYAATLESPDADEYD